MNKKEMCEELYSLQGNDIVKHRKSILVPLLLFIIGVVLLAVNAVMLDAQHENMKSAFVFIGAIMAISGLFVILTRVAGSDGVPYHTGRKSRLLYEEIYFDRSKGREIMEMIDKGDVAGLMGLERQNIPSLALMMYRTADNSFAACRLFEYSDLEYRPLCEIKIMGK